MLGEVYGVIAQPFTKVKSALTSAQAWCDIVSQHLNIKACTEAQSRQECKLTIYSGRKFYEKPEDSYKLTYRFVVTHSLHNYFQTSLTANKGPMGTSHYLIQAEAIPLTPQSSYLHFRYTYQYGFLASLAMKTYLATLGSRKRGFSIIGSNKQGKPVYVGGVRGIIERNTIRYFFAIQSYLETVQVKSGERFLARINKWYDLTERFPLQLHELGKSDYLKYKRLEHADQLRLQRQVAQPCTTIPAPAEKTDS